MKIYVFGHKGMLGAYVYAYLIEKKFAVIGISRDNIDVAEASPDNLSEIFGGIISPHDIVINCIGAIKPQVDKFGPYNAIKVNSIFPYILSDFCHYLDIPMLHITTDCIYAGTKGNYTEEDKADATDMYGLTKAAGEPRNCSVIRTSIIGEELGVEKRSLLEWVKSMEGKTIQGYTNHFWNGVTCLQLAKAIEQIIKGKKWWCGVRHYHSNDPVSKAVLVKCIGMTYCKDITFENTVALQMIDRTLKSIYKDPFGSPEFSMPDIFTQIEEQKTFYDILKLHYV